MTGLILLAAGASTRLGKPKQELLFEGQTLLQRATQAAVDSVCSPVVLVLSPNSDISLPESEDTAVITVQNQEWEEGMASSIRCGLNKLLAVEPDITSCIFMVCDQPYANQALLNKLVQVKNESGKSIVACGYKDTLGTPVLFDKTFFPELLALKGQEGAKKVIFKQNDAVASVTFSLGAIDIDTAEDYTKLLRTRES